MIRRAPFLALGLLTIVPVPSWANTTTAPLSRAIAAFPLVGLVLGGIVALVATLVRSLLARRVVSVIDLALLVLLTGGLHLDGLADSADGLGGGDTATERLAAMRDVRTGAFGTAAVALVLLFESASLAAIPDPVRPFDLVLAVVLSRWAMAIAVWGGRPARSEGLGAAASQSARTVDAIIASLIAALVVGALVPGSLVVFASALIVVLVVGLVAYQRIGGLTGDVHGAVGELVFAVELAVLGAMRG